MPCSYEANSPLISQVAFKQSGTTKMTTTRQYDFLNRLQSVASVGGSQTWSYGYQYNQANQRTRATLADDSFWIYNYDDLGQVISGKRYWNDGTPVAGQQFEYGFDDIGNRYSTKTGGDQNGANLRPASYTANDLNQYSSRTVPGYLNVLGLATPAATVSVNGTPVPYRRGEYFWNEVGVNNASAVYPFIEVNGRQWRQQRHKAFHAQSRCLKSGLQQCGGLSSMRSASKQRTVKGAPEVK